MRLLLLTIATASLAASCNSGCDEGEVLTASGECVEGEFETAEWLDDVLDGFLVRECLDRDATGLLDFAGACAYGGCRGDTYQELRDAWGIDVECRFIDVSGDPFVACQWGNGLGMHFDDDGSVNPDPTDPGRAFTVEAPFRETTVDGIGIGSSMGCLVERYGQPRTVFENSDASDIPSSFIIDTDEAHVWAWDFDDNGFVDELWLFDVN